MVLWMLLAQKPTETLAPTKVPEVTLQLNPHFYRELLTGGDLPDPIATHKSLENILGGKKSATIYVLLDRNNPIILKSPSVYSSFGNIWRSSSQNFVLKGNRNNTNDVLFNTDAYLKSRI